MIAATEQVPQVYIPPAWQVDPVRQAPIGVLCGHELRVFPAVDGAPSGALRTPSEEIDCGPGPNSQLVTAELMTVLRLSALWIVPLRGWTPSPADSPLARDWGRKPWASRPMDGSYLWHELSARGLGGTAELGGLVVQQARHGKGVGEPMRIHAPWVQDAWRMGRTVAALPEDAELRSRVVATGVLSAGHALGAQLRFSPSHTGLTMLRGELDRWQRKGLDLTLAEPWRKRLDALRAVPIQWARPEVPGQIGETVLHKYDRNGSYVASAREVGVGAPVEWTGPGAWPGMLGVFKVHATPPDWFDPARTPGPFYADGRWLGDVSGVWAWSPMIRLAKKHGWAVTCSEGLMWPKTQVHDLFRSWQDRIWAARQGMAARVRVLDRDGEGPAAAIAAGIVKQVGVASIGRLVPTAGKAVMRAEEARAKGLPILSHETDARGRETGMVEVETEPGRVDLIRPDWWSIIIANAVERLLEACYSHAREDCHLLYVDALYSRTAVPELAGDPNARGKFKLEATRRVPSRLAYGGDPISLVRGFAHGEAVGDA